MQLQFCLALAAFVGLTQCSSTSQSDKSGATREDGGELGDASVPNLDAADDPTPESYPIVVAAGDIAQPNSHDTETAKLISSMDATAVLTLGDNAYPTGTAAEFQKYYEPTWGLFKAITHPVPGNHDHYDDNKGYCAYFGELAHCVGSYSYHSFNVGEWHFVALDSGCSDGKTCPDPMATGSDMRTWLTADIAANQKKCTLAYWHHPRFSSGEHGDNTLSRSVWQELYAAGADVVLVGHDHNYERFAAQDPDGKRDEESGITQFVVGTGGTALRDRASNSANSVTFKAAKEKAWGVLKMTLKPESMDWAFVPTPSSTWTGEEGTIHCH